MYKTCTQCLKYKQYPQFRARKDPKDGLNLRRGECIKKYDSAWYLAKREYLKGKQREYYWAPGGGVYTYTNVDSIKIIRVYTYNLPELLYIQEYHGVI